MHQETGSGVTSVRSFGAFGFCGCSARPRNRLHRKCRLDVHFLHITRTVGNRRQRNILKTMPKMDIGSSLPPNIYALQSTVQREKDRAFMAIVIGPRDLEYKTNRTAIGTRSGQETKRFVRLSISNATSPIAYRSVMCLILMWRRCVRALHRHHQRKGEFFWKHLRLAKGFQEWACRRAGAGDHGRRGSRPHLSLAPPSHLARPQWRPQRPS